MRTRLVPVLGVVAAMILLLVASSRFPGGFDWTRDYISNLLRSPPDRPLPLDVRLPAIAAILCFAASLSLVFYRLSIAAPTLRHRKVIQIAGIASMVYASFTMTPMHDLMV